VRKKSSNDKIQMSNQIQMPQNQKTGLGFGLNLKFEL
jgi:hypothetical protein